MQEYDVKRQLKRELSTERLGELLREAFGNASQSGGHVISSYGALKRLECWVNDKKKICIETESRTDLANTEAAETIARYNIFLFKATGYSSKERRKRSMKVE